MNDLNLGASNDYDYESNSSSSESPSPLFSPKSSSSAVGLHTSTATMRPTKISLNILPRTSGGGYAVLESGGGSKGPRRFGWKSIVVLLAFFFGTLWLLGPRESYDKYMHPDKSDAPYEDIDSPKTVPTNQPHPPFVPNKGNSKVTVDEDEEDDEYPEKPKTLPTAPHSPETDPDPRKTVHCIRPHDPTKPLVQYALMLDAGSTGSRIHIYKFHNCFASGPTLEYEVFKMTRPGLSSYAGKPQDAAESLDELMAEAVKVVPSDFQGCTKVAVKATAGLRLLGTDASQDILDAVKARLKSNYKFQLAGADAVTIMDGKDEGVFAWITANYLLGTIGGTNKHDRPTYAVLDLGGASTQIVFEPRFDSKSRLEEGDHKYVLTFSGKAHTLYQHSYLGYGLMQARRSVHNLVAFMWDFKLQSHGHGSLGSVDDVPLVANPCLAKDTKKIIKLDGGKWKDEAYGYNVTMVGEDVGSFEACNRVVELVMAKDAICHVKPCSFNGVYQPTIMNSFSNGGILALSYFYDRISPLLPAPPKPKKKLGGIPDKLYEEEAAKHGGLREPNSMPISEIALLAQRVCDGPKSWEVHWGRASPFAQSFDSSSPGMSPSEASKAALDELQDRPEHCLDLTFMHALLRLGYEFGSERDVRFEKKVDDVELGWCLGATLAMVLDGSGDGIKCVA